MSKNLRVVELFAGVGGFRLGLEKNNFQVVWSNQWEPSTKIQHASLVYEARFGSHNHSNEDIAKVPTETVPDHDVLVGGFPCQDYSVATTLQNSKGLVGKKGVLWWSIHKILSEKKNKPKYLFLENVDRLLKSPASQRGRDFAVMLQSLNELGYAVEWRVINAAEYGMPQRRRRVFLIGHHKTSTLYSKASKTDAFEWVTKFGIIPTAFPVQNVAKDIFSKGFELTGDLVQVSDNFNKGSKNSPFENSGFMIDGHVTTIKTQPEYDGKYTVLGDILEKDEVDSEFYVSEKDLTKWEYLKGSKTIQRISKDGHSYNYSEGSMVFPDSLDNSSRTIITGEGGKTPSRFKHVVETSYGLRRLTPIELERLNMFPDNHTKLEGITNNKRAFFMGNALVVGVIEKMGKVLYEQIKKADKL